MDLLSELAKELCLGKDICLTEAEKKQRRKVVQLIEPNYGNFVTMQISAKEPVLHALIDLLTVIQSYQNTTVIVSGNTVTFTFSSATEAEKFRSVWD